MRLSAALLAAFLALPAAAPASPASPLPRAPDLSWINRDALRAGQVEVRTGKHGPRVVTVNAAILIKAEPKAIWHVLTACGIAPKYVSNVVSCSLLRTSDDGATQLFAQKVKPAFFLPSFKHVFRLHYQPYTRIDVTRVSGPIAVMQGSSWLLKQPDGTVILYHYLEVDPGFPIPRFLVRAILKRNIPRVLTAIRDEAEAAP